MNLIINTLIIFEMGNNIQYSTKLSVVNHPKFERSQIIPQKQIMKVQFAIENERQIEKWESKLIKHQKQIQIPEYFLLAQSYQLSEKGFCGAACIMTIFYQNYPYILEDQILNRVKRNQYFSQQELWYLLYILVNCANEFSRVFDCKVGDIRPQNIFFSQAGQIKLANQFSWPGQMENYEKSYYERESTFVSPQQMLSYTNMQNLVNHKDYQIMQSFSIGLTILQAGLLFDFSSLYNFRTFKLDHEKLMRKFKQWSQLVYFSEQQGKDTQYSPQLKNIVLGLCEIDPNKRLSSLQVHKWLIPYQKEIVSMHKFELISSQTSRKSGYTSENNKSKLKSKYQSFNYKNYDQIKSNKFNQEHQHKRTKQTRQLLNHTKQNYDTNFQGVNTNNYYHKPTITFNNNFQTSQVLKIEDLATHPFQFQAKKNINYQKKGSPIAKFQAFKPEYSKGNNIIDQSNIKISRTIKQIQTTITPKIQQTRRQLIQVNRIHQAKQVQSQYRAESSLSNTLKQVMNLHQKQKPSLKWSSDILTKIDQQINYSKKYFPE